MPVAVDQQLASLQRQIGEIKALLALPAFANASEKQGEIIGHFLSRALQMSEASVLISRANLGTPLFVLTRVLCEDLFLCLWVSVSENNSAEYLRSVESEAAKLVRILLEKGRGHIREVSTNEVKTDEFMPQLDRFKTDPFILSNLAVQLGLGKVYDLVYRPFSMQVHGKEFGLPSPNDEKGIAAALSAFVSLVKAIEVIADNRVLRNQTTQGDEIIHLLRLDGIAGK